MNIAIAGAGLGGLAAAISCARAGHAVVVIEKHSRVGGKLWAHSAAGFTFDCGPSLLTLPEVLRDLCGEEEYADLQVRLIDEICRYFWEDGTEITSHRRPEYFAASIARATNDEQSRYLRYFTDTRKLFRHIAPLFLAHDIHNLSLIRRPLFWKSLPHLPLRTGMISLHTYNSHYFRSSKTQQIFDRFSTYIGSSPYRTSAIYSLISFIEHGLGTYYPAAGMRTIPQLLKRTAERAGARIVTGETVQKIETRNASRAVHTVHTTRNSYECDAFISNMDALQLNKLLGHPAPAQYTVAKRTTSAIVYLWGVAGRVERFGLHNILFSNDYRKEFRDIFTHYILPREPTIYINISSKKIANDAPVGMENWFVMINTPATTDRNWRALAEEARIDILRRVSRLCQLDIKSLIIYEKILTPVDFAHIGCDEYGSLYGGNAHGTLGALRRPGNRVAQHPQLYRCGGTTHPGGGVPLALLSGQIAANYCSPQNISFPTLEYLATP